MNARKENQSLPDRYWHHFRQSDSDLPFAPLIKVQWTTLDRSPPFKEEESSDRKDGSAYVLQQERST